MTDSSNIKRAISLLCKVLNNLFQTELKPELFRLAKFDKSEQDVIPTFWKLLSLMTSSGNKDEKCRLNMHCEPPENVSKGSRELLIAVGFLIAQGRLDELIRNKCKVQHDKHSLQKVSSVSRLHNTIDSHEDMIKYLQWIKGRITFTKRITGEYNTQIGKIRHEILNNTPLAAEFRDLTTNEMLALYDSNHGSEFLQDTEEIVMILRDYESWLKNEVTFWNWMKTVVAQRTP